MIKFIFHFIYISRKFETGYIRRESVYKKQSRARPDKRPRPNVVSAVSFASPSETFALQTRRREAERGEAAACFENTRLPVLVAFAQEPFAAFNSRVIKSSRLFSVETKVSYFTFEFLIVQVLYWRKRMS